MNADFTSTDTQALSLAALGGLLDDIAAASAVVRFICVHSRSSAAKNS
jgi:hypothetical protein